MRVSRSSRNCGSSLFMQCFSKNVILVLFGECLFGKYKIKVLLPIGNTFERYGHLSIIFHKNSIFLYFDKKPPPFPEEEKRKKKMIKQQNIKYFEKAFS